MNGELAVSHFMWIIYLYVYLLAHDFHEQTVVQSVSRLYLFGRIVSYSFYRHFLLLFHI